MERQQDSSKQVRHPVPSKPKIAPKPPTSPASKQEKKAPPPRPSPRPSQKLNSSNSTTGSTPPKSKQSDDKTLQKQKAQEVEELGSERPATTLLTPNQSSDMMSTVQSNQDVKQQEATDSEKAAGTTDPVPPPRRQKSRKPAVSTAMELSDSAHLNGRKKDIGGSITAGKSGGMGEKLDRSPLATTNSASVTESPGGKDTANAKPDEKSLKADDDSNKRMSKRAPPPVKPKPPSKLLFLQAQDKGAAKQAPTPHPRKRSQSVEDLPSLGNSSHIPAGEPSDDKGSEFNAAAVAARPAQPQEAIKRSLSASSLLDDDRPPIISADLCGSPVFQAPPPPPLGKGDGESVDQCQAPSPPPSDLRDPDAASPEPAGPAAQTQKPKLPPPPPPPATSSLHQLRRSGTVPAKAPPPRPSPPSAIHQKSKFDRAKSVVVNKPKPTPRPVHKVEEEAGGGTGIPARQDSKPKPPRPAPPPLIASKRASTSGVAKRDNDPMVETATVKSQPPKLQKTRTIVDEEVAASPAGSSPAVNDQGARAASPEGSSSKPKRPYPIPKKRMSVQKREDSSSGMPSGSSLVAVAEERPVEEGKGTAAVEEGANQAALVEGEKEEDGHEKRRSHFARDDDIYEDMSRSLEEEQPKVADPAEAAQPSSQASGPAEEGDEYDYPRELKPRPASAMSGGSKEDSCYENFTVGARPRPMSAISNTSSQGSDHTYVYPKLTSPVPGKEYPATQFVTFDPSYEGLETTEGKDDAQGSPYSSESESDGYENMALSGSSPTSDGVYSIPRFQARSLSEITESSVASSTLSGNQGHSSGEEWAGEDRSLLQNQEAFKAAEELMTTERAFVDILTLLNEDFRNSVLSANDTDPSAKPIDEDILDKILKFMPELQKFNQEFLRDLEERIENWEKCPRIGDIIKKKGPYLKLYTAYVKNFEQTMSDYDEAVAKCPQFANVVKEFEKSFCCNLPLKEHMHVPVQRVMRYKLILDRYVDKLPDDSPDWDDILEARQIVTEVAEHLEEVMKQGEDFQKLLEIRARISGNFEVVKPGRVFLKEGMLMKHSRKKHQSRMLFLLSDVLLYTQVVGRAKQFKLQCALSLDEMKVTKPKAERKEIYKTEFDISSVKKSFKVSASTPEERDEWIEALNSAINEFTKKKMTFEPLNSPTKTVSASWEESRLGLRAPVWIEDDRASMCMLCTRQFSSITRRHHCRACGYVICDGCSTGKAPLAFGNFETKRVCDKCFEELDKLLDNDNYLQGILADPTVDLEAMKKSLKAKLKKTQPLFPHKKQTLKPKKEITAGEKDVDISGFLDLLEKKSWHQVLVSIKDNVLYFFKATEDIAPFKRLVLLSHEIKLPSQALEGASPNLVFQLWHNNKVTHTFKAKTKENTDRWIEAVRKNAVLDMENKDP